MTELDILGKRRIWYTISLVVILIGLGFLIFRGFTYGSDQALNFGLDFLGGSLLEFSFEEEVTSNQVREVLTEIDIAADARIQESAQQDVSVIIIRTHELEAEEKAEIEEALASELPLRERLRDEHVSAVIGQQLRSRALWAMLIASIAIVMYISFRFEFRFAIVAIIALLHDVVITVGLFAIMGREVNTAFVAGLLTIIGYSINDTIVIFDRIRENMQLMRGKPFVELANRAVVDTLPRSINTSMTTLIAILAIYFFGGASLQNFMLALFIGMFAGTYSSVFIASPLLVTWGKKIGKEN